VLDRCAEEKYYTTYNCRGNQHNLIWTRFEQLYPDKIHTGIGKLFREDREDWNYNLFYISQATSEYALRELEDRCNYNFLDPNVTIAHTAEQAEYIGNLIANYGYEEAGAGELIKYAVEIFKSLNFKGLLAVIEEDFKLIKGADSMKDSIRDFLK
jgi:hypothetical protein